MQTRFSSLRRQANSSNPDQFRQRDPVAKTRSSPESGTMKKRVALLLAIIGVPALAAPGDFGAVAGAAPGESESISAELAAMPAMPFERPGMSFPGSAYFYLDEQLDEAMIAIPTASPTDLGTDTGAELGQAIDAGPPANPFFSSASGLDSVRAHQCLSQAIWYEAASESEAGKRAVAQVILNRVAHPTWPSSVCGVVYQGSKRQTGCQFTFTCDGSLRRKPKGDSWKISRSIASDALAGSVYAPVGHATHYHTLWVNPTWASSLDLIGIIGAHRFYRNRGANGEKGAFRSGYTGTEPSVSGRISAPAAPALDAMPMPAPSRAARPNPVRPPAPAVRKAGSPAPSPAPSSAPAPIAAPPVTEEYRGSGAVKDAYSNAGQWKKRPQDNAESGGESGAGKSPKP